AATREPIPGALVWNGGTAWTRSGAGGAFEVRAPSGTRGRIEGTAAGHTRDLRRWQREENVPVTLALERAAPISGQVVDEAGKPLQDAEVTTVSNPEDMRSSQGIWSTRSGPDGRFVLRQLPAGRPHSLKATLQGFAPALQVADSKAPARLVLRRGATVFGRVVDGEGVPVAGADLKLSSSRISVMSAIPSQNMDFAAVSDAEGRFRIGNVSAGRFDLRALRRGFAAALVPGVTIEESEPRTDVGEIALQPGGSIEGIVVDESGKPVEGAAIMMTPGGSEGLMMEDPFFFHRRPLETGEDGKFRIEDLPRGRQVSLEVMHSELVSQEVSGVEIPTAEPLRIQLERPRRVEGRVTDRLGEPVAGARVIVSTGTSAGIGSFRGMRSRGAAVTEPDGRFVVSGLKPETIELQVSATGYRTAVSPGIRIPQSGQAEPVEIVLEPGTWLEGTVLDGGGQPVRDGSVHVQPKDPNHYRMPVSIDEEGHYEVGDLDPGPYQVLANPLRGGASARAEVEIRPGRNRLDLKVPSGTEVSGRVVDADGSALQGVTVALQIQPTGGDFQIMAPDRLHAVSSADGSFTISSVPDGDYRLTGRRPGLAASSLPGGVQVAGSPVAGLELRLSRAAAIRGQILGIPPEQTARVMISAHSEETGLYLQGTRDPSGGYRIDDVGPGTWTVVAFLQPQPPVNAEVQVSPGQEEVVQDLEFEAGFTLTGRVLLDRSPLAGAEVIAYGLDPENPTGTQRTTGHDGSFRLERLPEGSYRLMVMLPTGLGHIQKIDVSGDRDLIVEIAAGAIEGRLLTAEGLPVSGAGIFLRSDDPELAPYLVGTAARSDEQGGFEIPRIAAGAYTLLIEAEGYARAESRVVVTPGGSVHVDFALKSETR
ncbi:MAG TPA: carboxypeptidase-like regulatory domain-containing protein, partial [Thermoanaerobaculia bacterium]|nr:carboxypeptidase-like regulatory domain-containing protein [Thermoanaerobaculia bacterium]